MLSLYDGIGLVGALISATAFGFLQLDSVRVTDRSYLAAGAIGSALVLVSLLNNFNLPAFIALAAFFALSVVLLIRADRQRRRGPQ